jgi:predicted Fe-S protein YdhL (DUF1289 family)
MKLGRQFGGLLCGLGLCAALALPSAARQHPANEHPHPTPPPKAENRRNDRPPNASGAGNVQRFNGNKGPATPPPNGQDRWRNMSPTDKQKILQNEERLRHLPPAQQQVLRDRAQVWQRMTPAQRDHIRNDVLPKWRQMPPDRKQAIRQRLRVLQNMPESARNQRLNDPGFTRGMSEEDKGTLRDLSHLHVGGAPDPPNE